MKDERLAGPEPIGSETSRLASPGQRLDRFELIHELAAGGMATVYLGRSCGVGGFQRFVAIKRLHPHLASEPEFIQMFLDEARLAARIHHPNVVPILEIGATQSGHYLVMDYVEGSTLARLIMHPGAAGRPMPVPVAGRIIGDMLAGLHAAHELTDDEDGPLQLVHRDVSPQNVLVGVDGSSRIGDFGVARAVSKLSTTQSGQLKGKLAYMAPEQARGIKDIDRRADIFAAGVVLWEALTGRRLFRGDDGASTFSKVLRAPIPRLGSALPVSPGALEAVVSRALSRGREERYPTAAAFADDIERAVRAVGPVATYRDVARYLDSVLGVEISEQREVVRSWIARDPSRAKGSSAPPPSGVVDVSSSVSGVGPRSVRIPSHADSSPIVASARSRVGPIPLTDSVADRAELHGGRPRLSFWTAAAVLLVALALGWMLQTQTSNTEVGTQSVAPPAASQVTAPEHDLAPGTIASASMAAPVRRPDTEFRGTPSAPTARAVRPVSMTPPPNKTGSAAASRWDQSAAAPEDIVRNPYR